MPRIINPNPTYGTGFARSKAESAFPAMWDGLIAAYAMYLGPTSELKDWSGNKHHGTLVNLSANNWQGDGLDFPGTDEYIDLGDPAAFSFGDGANDKPFSIFARLYMHDASNFIIASKHNSVDEREWLFYSASSDLLRFLIFDESEGVQCFRTSDANITDKENGWHDFACTYDGSGGATAGNGMILYIDGLAVPSTASNNANYVAIENTPQEAQLGQLETVAFANGGFASVYFYNRILDAAEVSALHARPKGPSTRKQRIVAFASSSSSSSSSSSGSVSSSSSSSSESVSSSSSSSSESVSSSSSSSSFSVSSSSSGSESVSSSSSSESVSSSSSSSSESVSSSSSSSSLSVSSSSSSSSESVSSSSSSVSVSSSSSSSSESVSVSSSSSSSSSSSESSSSSSSVSVSSSSSSLSSSSSSSGVDQKVVFAHKGKRYKFKHISRW